VGSPVEVKALDHHQVEPDGPEDQHQPGVGAPDIGGIKLQQHQAADKDDEGENLVFEIFAGAPPGDAEVKQDDEETEDEQPQFPAAFGAALERVLGMTEARLIAGQALADEAATFEPIG